MERKSSMLKKLEKCLSSNKSTKSLSRVIFTKTKSCPASKTFMVSDDKSVRKHQVAPTGCFSVYVGPEEQRFVIRTKFVNHPLFKMLLEDAELEYGFNSEGPLRLPCEVDIFCKVLTEIHSGKEVEDQTNGSGYASCSPFSPARRLGKSDMAKGCSSYSLLSSPMFAQDHDQYCL